MKDESFHLTPLDARRFDFGKSLRGYDPERVEHFRAQVAEELGREHGVERACDALEACIARSEQIDARARG